MSEALEPVLTAGRVGFALDRFDFVPGERFEVHGFWTGVRGRRFMRPALTLTVGGRSARLLADLAHKPWDAEDGAAWTAVFPYALDADEVREAELTVAPDVTIRLPAPGGLEAVGRERPAKRPAAEPPRERESEPGAGSGERDTEPEAGSGEREAASDGRTLARELALAAEQRDAARRDREQALKEASSARVARERALADRRTALVAQTQAIEKRDAALAERDEAVSARKAAMAARERTAAERDAALAERDRATAERDRMRAERDRAVTEWRAALVARNDAQAERQVAAVARDALVSERKALLQTIRLVESDCAQSLAARDRALGERDAAVAARDVAVAAHDALIAERDELARQRQRPHSQTPGDAARGISVAPRLHPVEPLRVRPREMLVPRAVAIAVLLAFGLILLIVLRVL